MCTPCVHYEKLMSLDITPNPNSYLDSVTWLPGYMLFLHYRIIIILSIYVWLTLTLAKVCPHSCTITRERMVYECKSFWINNQEQDEMTQWISSRIPISIVPFTIKKNMSSWFNQKVTAWTTEVFVRKIPKMVFFYRGMICNSFYSPSA